MIAAGIFLAIRAPGVHVPDRVMGLEYVEDATTGFDIGGRQILERADLLSIGCSQTFGYGVRPEQNFTSLVAKHTGMTAANLAVPSFGGAGSVLQLERHAGMRPKVVLYGLWADHHIRNVVPCVESITPICIQRPVVVAGYRVAPPQLGGLTTTRAWVSAAGGSYFGRMRAAGMAFLDGLSRPAASSVDRMEAERYVLERMAADARNMGARLIVVAMPDYNNGWTPVRDHAALAERAGFTSIDATEALRAVERSGASVGIPGDGHLSAASHRAIADAVEAVLDR